MRMKCVGIMGKIGAGKTEVCTYVARLGFPVLNLDEEVHELYLHDSDLRRKIGTLFGEHLIEGDQVNRKELGKIVFSNPAALKKLEMLVYPLLMDEVFRKIRRIYFLRPSLRALFIEGAVLFKCPSFLKELSLIWLVEAREDIRLRRLVLRGLAFEDAVQRIESQKYFPFPETIPVLQVYNDGTLEEIYTKTDRLLKSL